MRNSVTSLSGTISKTADSIADKAANALDRSRRSWSSHVSRCTGAHPERGMSTAEYAVGTIAACAFAALLFKVVSSPEVQEMLSNLVNRALNTTG